jgi:radical SAM superfamily enzyme
MELQNATQNTQKAYIDAVANMLEVLPGDILILRPRPGDNS